MAVRWVAEDKTHSAEIVRSDVTRDLRTHHVSKLCLVSLLTATCMSVCRASGERDRDRDREGRGRGRGRGRERGREGGRGGGGEGEGERERGREKERQG